MNFICLPPGRNVLRFLVSVQALLWVAAAQAQVLSGPYVRFCNGNVHAWVYAQGASGVYAPGPSCPASAACLSPGQIAAKAYEIMFAANPASAAASANASALTFECTAAIRAGTDWKADLCRERRQYTQAHIKEATGIDPADGPTTEPACVPSIPAMAYVVSTAQAFPLTAAGGKSNTPWPTAPILGEPCDTSVKVTSYGVAFYRVPRLSATQTVVAGCKAKP